MKSARSADFKRRVGAGLAVLRDRRRYAREVASWQLASWVCRIASLYWFLRAFHVRATVHNALLADAWIHGRQNLPNGPPGYSGNNDFAEFEGKTYISFPPFPAVLMLPLVAIAGSPENFRDGQFMIWIAGLAPG